MKKIILFLIIITSTFSCKKNLDKQPIASPANTTFYSNQQELILGLNACYQYVGMRIPNFPTVPAQLITDMVTDILGTRLSSTDYVAFKTGGLNSSSNLAGFWWNNCYLGVNRANALINNMQRAEAVTDPVIFKRIKAEARVFRAIMYSYLIQNYGDVPLVTTVLTTEEALGLERKAKAQVAAFIYSEIDASVADLPTKYTVQADKGRITRGCAYAIKARVALYNSEWAIAKAAAKACIDLNVYKLYPNYRELFLLKASNNNDEVILDDQFKSAEKMHAFYNFNSTRNLGGQGQSWPTEDFIAGVECIDGKLITQSPTYDPTNPFVNRDPRLAMAVLLPRVWDGTTIRTPGGKFNGYECMTSREKLFAASTTTLLPESLYEKERVLPSGAANSDVTSEFATYTGYIPNKYLDSVNIPIPTSNYVNIMLCRYPEVLLMYAEASIETGTIDQSVLDAINMARARAYGNTNASGVTNINATNYPKITTTDPAELRKIVRRERKVELCFEGFRLQDLRRWGIMVKALNQRITYGRPENYTKLAPTDLPVFDADELVTFPYATQKYGLNNEMMKLRFAEKFGTITAAYNVFPIPIGEIQLNPKLAQNPGY